MTTSRILDPSAPVRIAWAPQPHDGESLTSWLNRVAHVNDAPLIWVLYHVGLADRQHHRAAPRGYGAHLTPAQANAIEAATGLPAGQAIRMVMSTWCGGPATATDSNGEDLLAEPRLFAYHNWLYTTGSNYCPQCLAENDGAWMLEWKLPWVFACTRHKTVLRGDCPACGLRADQGRLDGTMTPAFPAHVPLPGHCHNPRKNPEGKRYATKCDHDLAQEPSGVPVPAWLLKVQATVLQALHEANSPVDGRNRAEWWADLRALTIYALTVLTTRNVEDVLARPLPPSLAQAWDHLVGQRTTRLAATRRQIDRGMDHRQASKETISRTPPTDPLLLAAATAVALACMDNDRALATLVEATPPTGLNAPGRLRGYRASAHLLERAEVSALDPQDRRLLELGFHPRLPRPSRTPFTWNPENLPPFIWEDLFDRHLADAAADLPIDRRTLRRFASVALHRAAAGSTWTEAAERFADRVSSNPRLGSNILDRITSTHGRERVLTLLEAVHDIGIALNDDPRIATYPADREAATQRYSHPLPHAEYLESYPSGGTPTAARRTWAAAHAWAQECSDDRINAPVWGPGGPSESVLESYRRWAVLVSAGQGVCHPEPSRRQSDIDVRQV